MNGDIAGFVDFEACEDDVSPETVGEVVALYVRPEWWGLGIGEALMRDAMARLRDSGWVEVVLWVVPENRRAVYFCERLGFRIDESVRSFDMYGTPATRVPPPPAPRRVSVQVSRLSQLTHLPALMRNSAARRPQPAPESLPSPRTDVGFLTLSWHCVGVLTDQ